MIWRSLTRTLLTCRDPDARRPDTSIVLQLTQHSFFLAFGRLPRTWPILFVSVAAGLGEGLGLTMFVPVLELMENGEIGGSRLLSTVRDVFAAVGLPLTMVSGLVAIVVFVSGGFALGYLQRRMLADARHSCGREFRARIFASFLNSKWDHLSSEPQGKIVNSLTREVDRASAALQMQVLAVAAAVQATVLAAVGALLSWQMILLALGLASLMVFLARPLLNRAKRIGIENTDANNLFGFRSLDFLKGTRLIKVTGAEDSIIVRFLSLNWRLFHAHRSLDYNTALISFVLQTTPVILMAVIIYFAHSVVGLEVSTILVLLLLLARVAPRVAEIPMRYENYVGYLPGLFDVDSVISRAEAAAEPLARDGVVFAKLNDGISFEKVSFHYAGAGVAAVQDLNLIIPSRKMTAVVGSSGAGKSTVTDLIVGLRRPTAGRIMIDSIDLADIDLVTWRSRIGYVTQDPIMFNDSLRNNLLLTHANASDTDIWRALERAHLRDLVTRMPNGLDTELGEDGIRLSGGEKQRLAIARALVGNPALLILDEATSALDTESERAVQDAIDTLSSTLTIVVVAHRLSTVRKADRILVMEGGQIVETGSYKELLAREGRFATLHASEYS